MNDHPEPEPGVHPHREAFAQMDALRESEELIPESEDARSMLAVHGDPSLNGQQAEASARRGVSWVRPTELAARSGARAAGYGIDFQEELSRRFRTGIADAARHTRDAIRDRRDRLPDLSLDGRDFPQTEPVVVEGRELGLR